MQMCVCMYVMEDSESDAEEFWGRGGGHNFIYITDIHNNSLHVMCTFNLHMLEHDW